MFADVASNYLDPKVKATSWWNPDSTWFAAQAVVKTFLCPSDSAATRTDLIAVAMYKPAANSISASVTGTVETGQSGISYTVAPARARFTQARHAPLRRSTAMRRNSRPFVVRGGGSPLLGLPCSSLLSCCGATAGAGSSSASLSENSPSLASSAPLWKRSSSEASSSDAASLLSDIFAEQPAQAGAIIAPKQDRAGTRGVHPMGKGRGFEYQISSTVMHLPRLTRRCLAV